MSDAPIEQLKALAHPLRFRILEVLRSGERNVGEIEEASNIGQPALSQQLGVLRKAGLVETRKDSKLVYYSLGCEQLNEIAALIANLAPTEQEANELKKPTTVGSANFARLA